MNYKVIIPSSVEKQINKLSEDVVYSVIKQLEDLQNNPFPRNSRKLINRDGWRVRVGNYRIIYDVNTKHKEIYLRKIGHRKDIYR